MNTWEFLGETGMKYTLEQIKQAFLAICLENNPLDVPTEGYVLMEVGLAELMSLPPVFLPGEKVETPLESVENLQEETLLENVENTRGCIEALSTPRKFSTPNRIVLC